MTVAERHTACPSHGFSALRRPRRARLLRVAALLLPVVTLLGSGCAGQRAAPPSADMSASQARAYIDAALPRGLADRDGWAADLYAGFTVQSVPPTPQNVCAVVAVIEQESSFRVDPIIPGLPAIAWHQIDVRAAQAGVPALLVRGILKLPSASGMSYGERIDQARTERQLSDIYEDLIGTVPLGSRLFAAENPIRTRGPMQVQVAFAERYAAMRPYPYPVARSLADEVFSRRGGLYFGIAHLLAYAADYDDFMFRFADFNAGQYASRNAAFQKAVSRASGIPLTADGTLLAPDRTGGAGSTELAVRTLEDRLGLDDRGIHAALEKGKTRDFERTTVYARIFVLAEHAEHDPPARAAIPSIKLSGPKISRALTTEWYARRVDSRFQRCLAREPVTTRERP